MNLYLRYFQNEILVSNIDEAVPFLSKIPDLNVDAALLSDLRQYAESSVMYPKRYKVRGKSYFIVIKTPLATLEAFKQMGQQKRDEAEQRPAERRERPESSSAIQIGWYEITINFKRVVNIPETQKCQYVDTTFRARLKAISVQDCYNRVVDHLRSRGDVDPRSQFPSMRKKDFQCRFLGLVPQDDAA